MKKFCITLELLIIILVAIACGSGSGNSSENAYLRIQVRANSDEIADQNVKYIVNDELFEFLTPYLANCRSKNEAAQVIADLKSKTEDKINQTLRKNGFNYTSKVIIRNEKFPTRVYGDLTLESGYYDAVIVELGKAEGANWWCVVYPPLCFSSGENIEYRSKIADIIAEWKSKTKRGR